MTNRVSNHETILKAFNDQEQIDFKDKLIHNVDLLSIDRSM